MKKIREIIDNTFLDYLDSLNFINESYIDTLQQIVDKQKEGNFTEEDFKLSIIIMFNNLHSQSKLQIPLFPPISSKTQQEPISEKLPEKTIPTKPSTKLRTTEETRKLAAKIADELNIPSHERSFLKSLKNEMCKLSEEEMKHRIYKTYNSLKNF